MSGICQAPINGAAARHSTLVGQVRMGRPSHARDMFCCKRQSFASIVPLFAAFSTYVFIWPGWNQGPGVCQPTVASKSRTWRGKAKGHKARMGSVANSDLQLAITCRHSFPPKRCLGGTNRGIGTSNETLAGVPVKESSRHHLIPAPSLLRLLWMSIRDSASQLASHHFRL